MEQPGMPKEDFKTKYEKLKAEYNKRIHELLDQIHFLEKQVITLEGTLADRKQQEEVSRLLTMEERRG